jgi:hypothetical protein
MRLTTLRAVAEQTRGGVSFGTCLRDFLDAFRAQPSQAALDEEPIPLAGSVHEGDVYDAYLAATAEALACQAGLDTPAWTRGPGRALRRPWFAVPWAGLRAVLILESPAAFRSRNLFVSANALARA